MSPGQAKGSSTEAGLQPASGSGGISIPLLLARVGFVRLLAGPTDGLPPNASHVFTAFQVTPRAMQAVLDEGAGIPASLVQAGAVESLGDLPLIVLSRGQDQEADWVARQDQLLQLSSHSRHLIAEKSGHNIQLDQPEAAVGAILTMVEQLRQAAKK